MQSAPEPTLRLIELPPPDPVGVRRRRDQRRATGLCLLTLLLAGWLVLRGGAAPQHADGVTVSTGLGSRAASSRPPDADARRQLIGRWRRSFFGRQELTISADGTATVVAYPSGFWGWLLGHRLEVRFAWQLRDGLLVYHVTGGRPESKIQVARSLWGDHFVQSIRTLSDTTLVLEWPDGDIDQWFRSETEAAASAESSSP